jgi:hypothetical protein
MTDNVDSGKINISIEALKKYVKDSSIDPLLSALENLKQEPDNKAHLELLNERFNELGIVQGAVLTYAPYITLLLDDIFGDSLNNK